MPGKAVYQRASRSGNLTQAESQDPKSLIQHLVDGNDPAQIVTGLVGVLGRPDYSIMKLLADVKQFKNKIALQGPTRGVLDIWSLLDQAIEKCMALTTAPHEQFIDRTLHAFCHFDSAGMIVSANSKMLEWDPACVGKPLASYFGRKAVEVRRATEDNARRLYELEMQGANGRRWPVLAEFGSVDIETHESGYALLVDMSNVVGAEYKALEAAPYGMLKLDTGHHILYATEKVVDLVKMPRDELIGLDARQFLADQESRDIVDRQSLERKRGVGGEFNVRIKTKTNKIVQLRVTSSPNFDPAGNFCGSIMQLQSIDLEQAREKLVTLVATVSDHEKLYDEVLAIVRNFIEFDWANLFIYSPGRDYSRIVYSRGDPIDFVSRWFATPPGYIDWLAQPSTWMSDLEEAMSATAPEYLERVDTKAATKAGMKGLVCLPVRSGGKIIGGLCLASKQKNTYGAASRRILEQLNLEQACLHLFNIVEGVERDFVAGVVKEIARSEDLQQVAVQVVNGIAGFYKYENVSIFKINALRGQIQLLAQAVGKNGGTPMPSGYSQSIKAGVLGLCYRKADCVILKDRDDGSEEAKVYIKVAKETRSELCIPIKLFGRVLWILNLEDGLNDSFTPIEIDKLQGVIQQMQGTLERIFQGLILLKVLDVCPASIILTDQQHHILRCNRQARQMMQKASGTSEDNLEDFLDVPLETIAADPTPTTFLGRKGKRTEVMISRYMLEEEYDQTVFMLQNIADLEWTAKFETLRAALAETTAQVRVPVSLVSSFVKRIGEETEVERLQELARKATRQLGRIELTYDRVLASYEARTLPVSQDVAVDLRQVLDHILSDLPQRERDTIVENKGPPTVSVSADPFRVFFALNSMLAYLLRARSDNDPIEISTQKRDGSVLISMSSHVPEVRETHDLAVLIEATRAEIALGKDLLERIAGEMGGEFTFKRQRDGRERLAFRLELSPGKRRRAS
jgi:PAS domain-containing protein/putative methionine-R-sulfoxide reductase with GAF domain